MREQLVSIVRWNLENQPTFGVTRVMIGFDILFLSAIPSLLALAGWFVARQKRGVASVLVLSLAIWPAYHLLTGHSVSRNKHLVMGYMFAYALVGLALSALWGAVKPASSERIRGTWRSIAGLRIARRGLVVITILTLGVIGRAQLNQSDQAWADTRQTADYLVDQVQPGEQLLINVSWPHIMYLYTAGRIDSPWAVYDVYRITHGESEIDLCEYDWFVDSDVLSEWPEWIIAAIQQCGHFEQAFVSTSTFTGLSPSLRFERYLVRTVVWRNGLKG
jgi:hypothetical protein